MRRYRWSPSTQAGASGRAFITGLLGLPLCLAGSLAAAQSCTPQWDAKMGQPGMTQTGVFALTVHGGEVIAGGMFDAAGGQTVNHIARWDGTAWQPWESGGQIGVGDGYDARVYSLIVHEGDLVAGGTFTTIGGKTVNRIARWDGTEWHPFASGEHVGILSFVDSLGVEAVAGYEGDLFAAGNFYGAEGQAVNNIARWDGSQWHPVESGGQIGIQGELHALLVYEGELIAGGFIETAGGQAMNGIARWDGTQWLPFVSGPQIGLGSSYSVVWDLAEHNGDLIAGGVFWNLDGVQVSNIARWDGDSWHVLDSGGPVGGTDWVYDVAVYGGDIHVGGYFISKGGMNVNNIARWDGAAWHTLTSGGQTGVDSPVRSMIVQEDRLVVGGDFHSAGGQTANRIAVWDGCLVTHVIGDINGDDTINVSDVTQLAVLIEDHNSPPASIADINGDESVDERDVQALAELIVNP